MVFMFQVVMCVLWVMIETMVAGGQQALEPTNETMYYDYYPPDYQQYPGQGSPDLCPPLYDYGNVPSLIL